MNSIPVPVNLSPDDMATVYGTEVVLSHDNVEDAEGDDLNYTYQLYNDSLLTELVTEESGQPRDTGSGSYWMVPVMLEDGEDYYWRVRAEGGYEPGA